MAFNKSPYAFDDLRSLFDQAMTAEKGIRVVCESNGHALALRTRMNYLRKTNRAENGQVYAADHPMHMRSPWDKLTLRVPKKGTPDEHCLFVEKRTADNFKVEEL